MTGVYREPANSPELWQHKSADELPIISRQLQCPKCLADYEKLKFSYRKFVPLTDEQRQLVMLFNQNNNYPPNSFENPMYKSETEVAKIQRYNDIARDLYYNYYLQDIIDVKCGKCGYDMWQYRCAMEKINDQNT